MGLVVVLLMVAGCIQLSRPISSGRIRVPGGLWLAMPLVLVVTTPAWWAGYGVWIMVPTATFSGSVLVCSVAKRWRLLWSTLYAVLVSLLPVLIYSQTASSDQIAAYGRWPLISCLQLALIPAWIGGGLAWLLARGSRSSRRNDQSAV